MAMTIHMPVGRSTSAVCSEAFQASAARAISEEPMQAGDTFHDHGAEGFGATAVLLAQADDLHHVPAKSCGNEVVGEESDKVEIEQAAEERHVVERVQQDVPAIGANDDVEQEQQESREVPGPADIGQNTATTSRMPTRLSSNASSVTLSRTWISPWNFLFFSITGGL